MSINNYLKWNLSGLPCSQDLARTLLLFMDVSGRISCSLHRTRFVLCNGISVSTNTRGLIAKWSWNEVSFRWTFLNTAASSFDFSKSHLLSGHSWYDFPIQPHKYRTTQQALWERPLSKPVHVLFQPDSETRRLWFFSTSNHTLKLKKPSLKHSKKPWTYHFPACFKKRQEVEMLWCLYHCQDDALTRHFRQQSPLLHWEPAVSVQVLQHSPPSLAHSWGTQTFVAEHSRKTDEPHISHILS